MYAAAYRRQQHDATILPVSRRQNIGHNRNPTVALWPAGILSECVLVLRSIVALYGRPPRRYRDASDTMALDFPRYNNRISVRCGTYHSANSLAR